MSTNVERRVHVLAPWHTTVGPSLSLGMLTAYARSVEAERLGGLYAIHRPERADLVREAVENLADASILLCTDYLWTSDDNLALAADILAINPQTLVIHGGPNCPSYPADAEQFLRQHGSLAGILVHGEGEEALVELLEALGGQPECFRDGRIDQVAGVSFLAEDGSYVRTGKRERRANLDELPSPYLTGEFDHIDQSEWKACAIIESNRGCPYGCTFCDWGSLTQSRVRLFDEQRVKDEITWFAEHGFPAVTFTDANFGIIRRDIDLASHVRDEHVRTKSLKGLAFSPAKNTVRNLAKIVRLVRDANLELYCDMGLQSVDPDTLSAIHRSNIATENYLGLLAELRQHDNFVPCDLMMALPGQTLDSFRRDLQFTFDHDVMVRVHVARLLPNAPMNAPDYRAEHGIVADEAGSVIQTTSFTPDDRERMFRLVRTHLIAENLGIFRHVIRFLQWDHGVPGIDVLLRIADITRNEPERFPALTWLIDTFLIDQIRPTGWDEVFDEFRTLLRLEFDIPDGADLDASLAAQQFILPRHLRSFPTSLDLPHDVVAYQQSATRAALRGSAVRPTKPLAEFGPGSIAILADPLQLCRRRVELPWGSAKQGIQSLELVYTACFELLTPLRSPFAGRRFRGARPDLIPLIDSTAVLVERGEIVDLADTAENVGSTDVTVTLGRTRTSLPR